MVLQSLGKWSINTVPAIVHWTVYGLHVILLFLIQKKTYVFNTYASKIVVKYSKTTQRIYFLYDNTVIISK